LSLQDVLLLAPRVSLFAGTGISVYGGTIDVSGSSTGLPPLEGSWAGGTLTLGGDTNWSFRDRAGRVTSIELSPEGRFSIGGRGEIELLPGVMAIPEPSSWMLMLFGLAWMGTSTWMRLWKLQPSSGRPGRL
jgi:hypothetical protein